MEMRRLVVVGIKPQLHSCNRKCFYDGHLAQIKSADRGTDFNH
jgi:hypothetical protein